MKDFNKASARKPDVPEDMQARWQQIVDLMAEISGAPAGVITRADPPQIEVFVSSETEGNPFRRFERLDLNAGLYCERVMREGVPLLVPDALKDPEWDHSPLIQLGLTYYLGFPLSWPDGEIFGSICLFDSKENAQASRIRELMSQLQQLIEKDLRALVEAREREDLLAELQRHRKHLQEMVAEQTFELERRNKDLEERLRFEDLISDVSADFVDLLPDGVDIKIARALERICVSFGADHCGLFEAFTDLRQVESVNIYHDKEGMRMHPIKVMASSYPWAYHRVVEQGKPIIFSCLDALPDEASVDRARWEADDIQAMLMLPLRLRGRVTHLVAVWTGRSSGEWPLAHIRRLRLIGEILAKGLVRMRADNALLKSEKGLAEAQRIAQLGSWEWDMATGDLQWSAEVFRIFGVSAQEFGPSYEAFLASVHPDDRRAVKQAVSESLSSPEKAYSMEHRVVRPDGTERVVHARGEVTFDADGTAVRMIGTVLDITERKRTEEALGKALGEIKRYRDQLEAENIYLRQKTLPEPGLADMVGQSDAIRYAQYRVEQVARTKSTVLLSGETGTGKGIFAHLLHEASDRKGKRFVHVNCAGLPPNLIESELFGREKGAFTGATQRQIGRFELANGGTIFLDEIGELPLEVQSKLLKVIESGEFERLGSPNTVKVDVRIVACTNRNLEKEVKKGRFRRDLFYRLNVFPITIPPLRQRKEDIPLLVRSYVHKFSKNYNKEITHVPEETVQALQNYEWPGNVRELINVIERAVITSDGPVLGLAEKIDASPADTNEKELINEAEGQKLRGLEDVERDHILRTLQEAGWKIEGPGGAAQALRMNPSTLRARMKKLGVKKPRANLRPPVQFRK